MILSLEEKTSSRLKHNCQVKQTSKSQQDKMIADQPRQILIVADEPSSAKLLNQRLSSQGYFCEEADSAQRAMEKLRVMPAELVILDLSIPAQLVTDLLLKIKTGYPDTAIIIVTDNTRD